MRNTQRLFQDLRQRTNLAITVAFTIMLVISASPVFALGVISVPHGPNLRQDSVKSTNWSGYAVTGGKGSVNYVSGSWTVPAIQGTCPSTNQYSSDWVGIDGYNSGTVEQAGTDSDCKGGTPTYYAWYEFYPHPSFLIGALTVHPGDKIVASVQFSGRSFTLKITDTSTGQSFSTSAKVNTAQRSSAEWITEAPSSSGGILPLADFGTISWGTDGANTATIGGVSHMIGSWGSNVHQITMVTSGGAAKASPSSLASDGSSFSVSWVSSGP